MIDFDGYRPNVGIVICNRKGQVLWAKRYGQNSWQFPQGGINDNESAEQAMYRELYEEVGLQPKDVKVLYASKHWLRYKLPKRLLRYDSKPVCIGQKQRWFLLQLVGDEKNINMNTTKSPEFDGWRWVSFWYPQVMFDNEKTLLENSQEHETNKPYHAPRKNGSSKYQKRSFYKSRGQ